MIFSDICEIQGCSMDIVLGDGHFRRSLVDLHVAAALTIRRTILLREGVCKNRGLHSGACLPSLLPCSWLFQRLQFLFSQLLALRDTIAY